MDSGVVLRATFSHASLRLWTFGVEPVKRRGSASSEMFTNRVDAPVHKSHSGHRNCEHLMTHVD